MHIDVFLIAIMGGSASKEYQRVSNSIPSHKSYSVEFHLRSHEITDTTHTYKFQFTGRDTMEYVRNNIHNLDKIKESVKNVCPSLNSISLSLDTPNRGFYKMKFKGDINREICTSVFTAINEVLK